MPGFVESATLQVIDKSSAQIRKINAELQKLAKTAQSIKSTRIDFGGNLNRAAADVRRLTGELRQLQSVARNIQLRVNPAGIASAQRQIAQLHATARRPITLRTVAAAAAAWGVTSAVGRATREGTKQADLGKTNLDQLQLDAARRKYAEEQIADAERRLRDLPGPYQFNTGFLEQRMAEALREVREGEAAKAYRIPLDPRRPQDVGDPRRSRAATAAEAQAESQRRMRVAGERVYQEILTADQIAKDTGVSATQSVDKIKGYYKALDMAGWLSNESGENTIENIRKSGDFIRTMRGAIGEEATGAFFANMIRREKAAKFAPTEKGQLAIAFIAEDMGAPTAGTAFSTWMNQVQGAKITRAAREAQVRAGMAVNPRYGKRGKFLGADTVDAELAATDPLAYARKRYIPALQKMGMKESQIFSNDPKDIAVLSNNLRKLHSDTNAANFAITVMTHLLELEAKTRDAYTRSSDPRVMAEATRNSITAATNAVQSSFQGMMGQMVVAAAPTISKTADVVSGFLKDQADEIKAAGEGDVAAQGRLAFKAALAIGPGLAAYKGARWLMAQTGVAGAVGTGAGLMAMTSDNNATRSLGGAGISLIEAADALKGAAADLSRASGVSPLDFFNLPGKGGPAKPGGSRLGQLLRNSAATLSGGLMTAGRWILTNPGKAAGWGAALTAAYTAIENLPDDPRAAREALENAERLTAAKRKLASEERTLQRLTAVKTPSTAAQRAIDHARAEIERLKGEIALREAQTGTPKVVKPERVKPSDMPKLELEPPEIDVKPPKGFTLLKVKPDTEAPETPSATATGLAALSTLPGAITAAAVSMATSTTSLATAGTTMASQLAAGASAFELTFGTGARAITGAGTTTAEIIRAGAEGAGAAYGNAAVARIEAAVANLNINVQTNVRPESRPDTGEHRS